MSNKFRIYMYYLKYKHQRFHNKDKLIKYQNKKIEKQLNFIKNHSKFYKKYTSNKLKDFPIMDKKIMMGNFDDLNTIEINKDEALEFAINSEKTREFKSKLNGITVGLSSGTSDTRGIFLVSDKEKDKWAGYILARYLGNDLYKGSKIAFFMRADSNLYESLNSKQVKFEFFDIFKPMKENVVRLEQFKPNILVGQPSILIEIAKNKINIKPDKIISIAEVLEKNDEEYIKKAFNKDVIHQVYQCTEGCLATTCEYGTLHLNEDIVFVEKEYLDKNRFIPIITDFTRKSQPIIRYRLNDILVEGHDKCKCGSCFTVIDKIEGREDDVYLFNGIKEKTVKVYPDFIRRCILFAGDISDYRCVQNTKEKITIYIDENKVIREKIYNEFKKLSEQLNFIMPDINFEKYSYDKKRKLKRVESLVKE